MFIFKINYFLLAIIIFIVEVLIALYIKDTIIRPFIGDTLVVILIYAAYRSVIKTTAFRATIQVLAFSFIIETLQYFKFVNLIGLKGNKLAQVVLGTTFSVWDLVAYTAGALIILWVETKRLATAR